MRGCGSTISIIDDMLHQFTGAVRASQLLRLVSLPGSGQGRRQASRRDGRGPLAQAEPWNSADEADEEAPADDAAPENDDDTSAGDPQATLQREDDRDSRFATEINKLEKHNALSGRTRCFPETTDVTWWTTHLQGLP